MPAREESRWASSWISRLASCAIPSSWLSAGTSSSMSCSKAPAAIREATSPAWAPPIPSATANTGELAK